MSRAYQIRVSESVVRVIHIEDGVQAAIEILPILAKERMAELLADELVRRGFVRDGDAALRSEADGTEVLVDLVAGTLSVHVSETAELARAGERSQSVIEERVAQAEPAMRERLRAQLEREIQDEADSRRRALTKRLEDKVRELKAEIDQITTKVTANALKERAAQLGEIESIHEGEDGSLTIKVKV
jgi:hypothetical protein